MKNRLGRHKDSKRNHHRYKIVSKHEISCILTGNVLYTRLVLWTKLSLHYSPLRLSEQGESLSVRDIKRIYDV